MTRRNSLFKAAFCILILLLSSGCQALFTSSAFGFLKPAPSELPPAQLAQNYTDIITNGTDEEIAAYYSAVQTALAADPDNGALNYAAANLALTTAGVKTDDFLFAATDMLNGEMSSISALIATVDSNLSTLIQAGDYFINAETNSQALTENDELFAGVAMLASAYEVTSVADFGLEDFSTPEPGEQTAAIAYLQENVVTNSTIASLLTSFNITLPAAP